MHRSARSRVLVGSALVLGAIPFAALASGCSASTGENIGEEGAAVTVAESSYVSDAVLGVLQQSPGMQGKTWNVSHDNTFDADWLVNSPLQQLWGKPTSSLVYPAKCTTNCDADFALQLCSTQSDCTGGGTCTPVLSSVKTAGAAPKSMCVGHSFGLVDRVYNLVTSAQSFVDITSLSPPDGQFRAAIRNGITLLSARPNPPEVRIITAEIPVEGRVNTKTETQDYTRDVASSSNIKVSVGAYRSSDTATSWNHSKMVAIDGKTALVGGHNMWSQQYLSLDPVNDTSMVVHGTAAADAHRFANQLWNYVCTAENWETWLTWSVWGNTWVKGSVTNDCPAQFNLAPATGPSTGTVISVGRLGTGIADNGNQADAARLAMINSAKTTLRIVQQDIGPVTVPYLGLPLGSWPTDELAAISEALLRGVDVYIVLSDLNAAAGGLPITQATYSNGWSPTDVGNHIKSYMQSTTGYPQGADLDALLCSKLHLAPFRYNDTESTWPDGVPFASHTKIVQVDAQAVFIASYNMYPANLQEFGYIVDDSRVTGDWLAKYWANAWRYSSTAAVSGPEAASCAL
jgi:phosphatidylserine/phosphatidylglycerophosphate/cardiolipin synthase-like enzyme